MIAERKFEEISVMASYSNNSNDFPRTATDVKSLGKVSEKVMNKNCYSIILVNVNSMNVVGYLVGHTAPVLSLVTDFSHGNNFLLSVSKDNSIKVYYCYNLFYIITLW
jgi:WD40 repeat protein